MTNTKSLFISVLKALKADLVCDVGSRDGDQALLFRHVLPHATVLAFEANPINFEMMRAKRNLERSGIELYPWAISNQRGRASFHIVDVDYSDPHANRGTSSLLVSETAKIQRTVEVETHRIDELIPSRYPAAKKIGIWIDVEGAEYDVLEGIAEIADRVAAIHVETTNKARWQGQRPLDELDPLLARHGFVLCARNFGSGATEWGDAVFLHRRTIQELGPRLALCKARATLTYAFHADQIAASLKTRAPWLYRFFRWVYLKLGV